MFSFKTFPGWIKLVALTLSFNLLVVPLMAQAAENNSLPQDQELSYEQICAQAEEDATKDEGGAIGYGIGGFLCGIVGYLIASASKTQVPAARLVGKDSNYAQAYTACYEKKAKSIRTKAACTGWVIGAVVSIVYLAASGGFETETTTTY